MLLGQGKKKQKKSINFLTRTRADFIHETSTLKTLKYCQQGLRSLVKPSLIKHTELVTPLFLTLNYIKAIGQP